MYIKGEIGVGKKQRPIRLCFVMPGAYQLFHSVKCMEHGGAELNLYFLSKMFALDERYEVSFIVEDQRQKHIEYYENVRVVRLTGLRWGEHKPDGKLKKLWLKLVIEFSTAYEMLFNRYDCVLVTTGSLILSRMVFWGQIYGKKRVVFRFANDYDVDPHHFESVGESKWKDRIYWWGLKKAKALIFQTKQQKSMYEKLEQQSGVIIKNGFYVKKPLGQIKKRWILWVSRASEVKRPELFLELARQLPNEQFMMIMPGINEISTRIQEEVVNMSNVSFQHYVPFDEIQTYFDEAKLFVNTSVFEGFPNTFIQCGMGQTPVLSFCIDPDQIIQKYQLGYVCDDSVEKAVAFIQNLKSSEIQLYGKNIRKYTLEEHDIEKIFRQYEKLFHLLFMGEELCELNSYN